MRTTAKVDYAVRAAVDLAGAMDLTGAEPAGGRSDHPVPRKAHQIAAAAEVPLKFLESILADLRRSGIVASQRGSEGGYWLARRPADISVADIIRAVEGPLADVRGVRPDALDYGDDGQALQRMWVAVRANLRAVLEHVSLADLRDGRLTATVEALAADPDAWSAH